ncbi:MAG: CRTAC1 family protein [Roseitalea sp.]|nr:CRTAC1 family protein [Roseitalea sp.]MBO6950267.1 CRTAC1 family protein [Rhizobiaceae bacterium]MBO6591744.1 CRTAC1 family protein [Roseitalea sp.]MBO6599599.1 CRTAC1 family protein [Roseitalea sp.]MBO6611913.1 CRTAC1 family protein [Roseitalea sp.]
MRRAILLIALLAHAAPAHANGDHPVFVDRSADLPVQHIYAGGWEHFVGGGVAVFDCNGDARPDAYAAGGENPARLFVNVSEAPGAPVRFERGADLPELTGVTGAYPLDIDSDGHMDLVVLRVGPNVILKGGADCRFTDATAQWALAPGEAWSTSFSATWEDGQHWPTLAVGNYVDRADPEGPFEACDANELHRPAGRRFAPPIRIEPGFCALSMLISDERRLGRPFLRISNDRHYYVRGGSEQKLDLESLTFLTETDGWPNVSLWGMGIAARDLTGDGRAEVMSTSMGDQLLQIATDTGYEAAPFEMGSYAHRPFIGDDGRPSTGWHAEFGDVDNDGRDDLFIAKGNVDQMPSNAIEDPNNLLVRQPDGSFAETAHLAGVATTDRARGAALADLNADGKLDLIVVNRRAPLEVHENATPHAGNWVMVDVRQSGSNINAVGAIVESRFDGRIHTREITIGGGHAGGSALPQHFGLGDAETAEIRVIWPDGEISDWLTLDAGRTWTVTRNGTVVIAEPR